MKASACIVLGLLAALGSAVAGATAAPAKPLQLPTLTSMIGSRAPIQVPAPKLKAGATYRASLFPLALRVTANGGWSGGQGRTLARGVSETEKGPYGWVELTSPLGMISMITAYGRTPSVAAIVNGLRTRGSGATYEDASPTKLGGYAGVGFDGEVVGTTHHFVPFTPPSGSARFVPDSYELNQGDVFRILVIGVRGKPVVLFLTSNGATADSFPKFLAKADVLLSSLRFPGG